MIEKRNIRLAGVLIGGGILLLLAGIAFAWVDRNPAREATPTPGSVEKVRRVSLADAKAAFDAGTAVFLDVRDANSHATSHIPGAVSIPLNDLTTRMNELDPATWIVPYCT